jgi:hypothetical protein
VFILKKLVFDADCELQESLPPHCKVPCVSGKSPIGWGLISGSHLHALMALQSPVLISATHAGSVVVVVLAT